MTDFESFFGIEALRLAVTALLDGHFDVISDRPRISTGSDRIDLDLFLRDRELHLAAIQRKVLEGRFTFSPFLEKEIPKPDSKEPRTISIASIRDSIVQRALYEYLYPPVDAMLSPSIFGYRKGRKAHNAIKLIRQEFANGKVYVFDADLRKFFDTVNHDVLLEMVNQLEIDCRAKTLIRRFLKTGKIPAAQVKEHKSAKGKLGKYIPTPRLIGVPQGGVLSGLLSNLYLSHFDSEIRKKHTGYVRYADDFLVCCQSADECLQVHGLVKELLIPLKVELHPDKTKECISATTGVDFLGFRISTRGVRIRGRNVSKFKSRILEILKTQEAFGTPEHTLSSLVRKLKFKIRGPSKAHLKKLADRGKVVFHCRRSWIGYFRIVDDMTQVRNLDRWLRKQVSAYIWEKHRSRVRLRHMQTAGMPSLVNSMWKARSAPKKAVDEDKDDLVILE